jgi:hypothetical protein
MTARQHDPESRGRPVYAMVALVLVIVAVLLAAGCMVENRSFFVPTPTPVPLITQTPSLQDQSSVYWIKIDPISDKLAGDVFTVTSTTNLSAGDEILVQVYSLTINSLDRRKFSGASDYVKVLCRKPQSRQIV